MNKKNTKRRIDDLNHTISQININRTMSGGADDKGNIINYIYE